MLSLGKLPTQVQYTTLLHNPTSQFLQFPSKTHLKFSTPLNFHVVLAKIPTGFCSNAIKTKKKGDINLSEMDGLDDFEDDFDDGFLDDDEFEDDDDDDEVIVPLKNMKEWVENRPRGFGEGKEYDTSVEDKLMEEMEQSRKAQLANVNKLKNSSSLEPGLKKGIKKEDKGAMNLLDGFRVRLVNLPKKKNIHKDLKVAFTGVPGILNIVPVVSGNEKTRDPVCKGIAFVDFKYQDEAQRFVQNFSDKSIIFGKVEKQIKCEMTSSKPKPASDQSVVKTKSTPLPPLLNFDKELESGVKTGISLLDSVKESVPSELDDADEKHIIAQFEDDEDIKENSIILDSSLVEESEIREEAAVKSSSPKQGKKVNNEKKGAPKKKKDKVPKLNIPGSSNRLKVREKEMLTDVFSKYGANAALIAKQQSR